MAVKKAGQSRQKAQTLPTPDADVTDKEDISVSDDAPTMELEEKQAPEPKAAENWSVIPGLSDKELTIEAANIMSSKSPIRHMLLRVRKGKALTGQVIFVPNTMFHKVSKEFIN